jgi:fimbrial isopeptide formation D2 family protein
VVNRAKPGLSPGDFGSFILTLDEVRPAGGGGGGGGDGGCGDGEDDEMSVDGPASAARGDEVTYDVTYTNGGTDDDDDCEVEDELDDDTDFRSASAGGTYDPSRHAVTWKLGRVPAGATVRMRVTATVSPNAAPGTVLVNRALVSSLGLSPATAFTETVVVP